MIPNFSLRLMTNGSIGGGFPKGNYNIRIVVFIFQEEHGEVNLYF
jgi:hypothetical protein